MITDAPLRPEVPDAPEVSRGLRRAPRSLIIIAVATLIPVVAPLAYLVWQVLTGGSESWSIIFSARTAELIVRTAWLTLTVTAAAVGIGVSTAWLTSRTALPARRLWATALALPLVVPSYVGALVVIATLGRRGLIAEITGLESVPTISGFWGAWLVLTLFTFPYVHLMVGATLRRLDPALEEAARGLGSTPWRTFRTITLPQLRPAISISARLVALYAISDFGAVSLMRYDSFTRAIFAQYQGRLDRTPAMTLAFVLILLAFGVLWIEQRLRRDTAMYPRTASRPPRPLPLTGGAKGAAISWLTLVATLSLAMPLAVLTWWLIRGLGRGQALGPLWQATWGSLAAGLASAVVATAVAIPVAILVVRFPSRLSRWIRTATWSIYALPHLTVALAIVSMTAVYARSIYQSFGLLIAAYVAIFLPQAAGAAAASLRRINPHLEDASRSLGHGWWATTRAITVPLMRSGLTAGAALVFLTVMKELPATLLLRPTGFETLAVRIWATTSEGFFTRASALSLILLAAAAVPMYLATVRDTTEVT